VGKLLCRLFGHDRKAIGTRKRVCLRCGMRETLRRYGRSMAWEEMSETDE
jgi:Prophage protein (DUF1660)